MVWAATKRRFRSDRATTSPHRSRNVHRPMKSNPVTDAPKSRFAVRYDGDGTEDGDESQENSLLTGEGTLDIRTKEPLFVFSGRGRGKLFVLSEPGLIALRGWQVSNVVVQNSRIQFWTVLDPEGAGKPQPFIFYAESAEIAAEIGGRLTAKETAPTEEERFVGALKRYSTGRTAWGWVTNWVIALNAVAFVVMGFFGAGWVGVENMTPYILFAANNAAATTDGEWWRLITSMFVHYGVIHLLLNMWALFQAGHLVEKLFGRRLFALGYLGSGLIAGFVSMCWHGDTVWSAGASGAVFGVYGMLLGYLLREKRQLPPGVFQQLMRDTVPFALYNIVFGLVQPRIDNAAHVGGLIGGFLFGALCVVSLEPDLRSAQTPRRLRLGLVVLMIAVIAGVVAAPRYDYNVRDEMRRQAEKEKSANPR